MFILWCNYLLKLINMEKWKTISDSIYEISNYWNLRSSSYIHKWSLYNKALRVTKNWYTQACLYIWKKHLYPYIHRLVAFYFVENPNWYLEVNHIDWIKSNNHHSNLEWVTRQDNLRHAFRLWLHKSPLTWKFGKDNPLSKKVYQYKDWVLINEFDSLSECANCLDIDPSNISKVCRWIQKTSKWFAFTY